MHALRTVHLTALPNESQVRDGRPIPQAIDFDAFRSQIDLLAISVIKAKCDTTKKALNKYAPLPYLC